MAYPYQISSGLSQVYPAAVKPILRSNGSLYQVLSDLSGTETMRVMKSTDAGVTWAEQDAANAPTTLTSDVYHPGVADDGTRIWCCYSPSGTLPPTESVLKAFNTSTEPASWETAITGGPPALRNATPPVGVNLSNDAKLWVIARANGEKVVIYTEPLDVGGVDYQSLKFAVYSGSWGTPVNLAIPGTTDSVAFSYCLMGAALGATGLIHVFIGSASSGYAYATIKADDTVANYRRWDQNDPPLTGMRDGLWGQPSLVTLGGNGFAAMPIMAESIVSNNFRPGVLMVPDTDPPYSHRRDFIQEDVPRVSNWISVALAQDASTGAMYLLWTLVDGGDDSTQVRVSCSKGFGWSAPSDLFVSAAGDLIETVEASAADGVLRWVLDNANGSGAYLWANYYQSAVTCAAPGCPATAARGNINSVR